jgi:hypothetical protein
LPGGPSGEKRLVRVDVASGDRSLVPSDDPALDGFATLAIADGQLADGRLVALARLAPPPAEPSVVLVDPESGERVLLSGPDAGSGPFWEDAVDVAAGEGGIFVLDADAILRADPATGVRSVVSDPSIGSGESFGKAVAIARAPDGRLYVAGPLGGGVGLFGIDPGTGDRARITASAMTEWLSVRDLAVRHDGTILVLALVLEAHRRQLDAVDPSSGARTTLARGDIAGVAVVPEPARGWLGAVALATLLACAAASIRSPS